MVAAQNRLGSRKGWLKGLGHLLSFNASGYGSPRTSSPVLGTAKPRWALRCTGATLATLFTMMATAAPAMAQTEKVLSIGDVDILGDDVNRVQLGVGAFNIFPGEEEEEKDVSAEGRVELRLGQKLFGIGPRIGILANSDGGVYGYGGVYADAQYRNWVLTPFAGLGGYARGDGPELGGVFQFHVGLDLAYQLEFGRIGLKIGHISNAGIHDDNPGSESLLLTYSLPFGFF